MCIVLQLKWLIMGMQKREKSLQLDGKIFKWLQTKLGNWPFRLTEWLLQSFILCFFFEEKVTEERKKRTNSGTGGILISLHSEFRLTKILGLQNPSKSKRRVMSKIANPQNLLAIYDVWLHRQVLSVVGWDVMLFSFFKTLWLWRIKIQNDKKFTCPNQNASPVRLPLRFKEYLQKKTLNCQPAYNHNLQNSARKSFHWGSCHYSSAFESESLSGRYYN